MRRLTRLKGLFEIYYKNIEKVHGMAIIYVGYSPYSDIVYIGKTEKHLDVRKEEHFQTLRAGNHSCKVFQQLYNCVGEKNIIFKVVDRCLASEAKTLETRYHRKYNSKFAVCSHKYNGKDFFNIMFKYVTDPYFEPLKFSEKFIIEIYMNYYRSNNEGECRSSQEIIQEVSTSGMKLLQEEFKDTEFRKILGKVINDLKMDEIDINDSVSKYMYIKMIYDIYNDEKNELKKILIDNIYKEKELYDDLLNLSISYAIEYDTSEKNTLKSMDMVINEIFGKQFQFKPRYSDLVYYYWLEESCRYLFKKKYSVL
ncbi:GIY-YIG nuclease family protein [Clostridium uliginosum]|uniref:GIY-YIG catalytic domain-containing protein n=1 Tax=Clostridium uliginosum TaxID=119641 RepID=A0A1I1GVS7_9CLOT|nr:GIY-YIG nuclease family protein [Clostridium uliginosum]SFC13958.1 GIY-YIG catalytic domain-containing protein [Clostridium uliginosum]